MALPPLLLAAAGLTHPMTLTTETAPHWVMLHIALVPVFPLLAVSLWVLLRGEQGVLPGVARVAAFLYACFYGALDAVNGIAVGMVVWRVPPDRLVDPVSALRPVLDVGNTLAWVGSIAFLVAAALTSLVLVRRQGRAALPGAILTMLAAVSFLDSHIYWPHGVLTMVGLAVGMLLLAAVGNSRARTAVPRLSSAP